MPSAWEVQSLNPWTAREIQDQFVFQETNSGDHAEKKARKRRKLETDNVAQEVTEQSI